MFDIFDLIFNMPRKYALGFVKLLMVLLLSHMIVAYFAYNNFPVSIMVILMAIPLIIILLFIILFIFIGIKNKN